MSYYAPLALRPSPLAEALPNEKPSTTSLVVAAVAIGGVAAAILYAMSSAGYVANRGRQPLEEDEEQEVAPRPWPCDCENISRRRKRHLNIRIVRK